MLLIEYRLFPQRSQFGRRGPGSHNSFQKSAGFNPRCHPNSDYSGNDITVPVVMERQGT